MIPYGSHNTSEEDIAAVNAVLQSDFLVQGPAIERFERVVAEYCGTSRALMADCRGAEHYHGEAISLPLYPALSKANQNYIAATLRDLLT